MGDVRIAVLDDYEQMSHEGAKCIGEQVLQNEKLMLCAATGSTPTRCYELLSAQKISYEQVILLMLDEWGDVPETNTVSCAHFLKHHLVDPLNIQRFVAFNTQNEAQSELEKMDTYLAQNGPIDLCVLGIGTNGHLGFNEPADHLQALAHQVQLTNESLNHPMIAKLDPKPSYGITLGMAQILQSKKIFLFVNGSHKKPIMHQFMKKEITPECPASFLWLHPEVTVFCDSEAYPTS